jgi:hypothetical protein
MKLITSIDSIQTGMWYLGTVAKHITNHYYGIMKPGQKNAKASFRNSPPNELLELHGTS